MGMSRWMALVVLVAAGRVLGQDERPKFSLPEPQKEERRPAGTFTITELLYQITGQEDRFPTAIPELGRFFKGVSADKKIETALNWNQLSADNPGLKQTTLLYMTGNTALLQFSEAQKTGLGEYLKGGGLLFVDEIRSSTGDGGLGGRGAGVEGTPFDRQFKALLKDPLVLGESGARWERIPKNHPLYATCFDFPDGPPMGGAPGGNVRELEMLELRGRVAVIFSDLNISWYWGDHLADSRERGLQFGVNLLVFAMTQRAVGPALRPGTL